MPRRNKQPSRLVWFIVGFLVAWVVKPTPPPENRRKEDQQQEQKQGANLKDSTLIVIRAVEDDESVETLLTLQDDKFWKGWVPDNLAGYEFFDDDDTDAKKFLEDNDLTPPVVFLLNKGKPVWVMKLPEGGTDKIKEKLLE